MMLLMICVVYMVDLKGPFVVVLLRPSALLAWTIYCMLKNELNLEISNTCPEALIESVSGAGNKAVLSKYPAVWCIFNVNCGRRPLAALLQVLSS